MDETVTLHLTYREVDAIIEALETRSDSMKDEFYFLKQKVKIVYKKRSRVPDFISKLVK